MEITRVGRYRHLTHGQLLLILTQDELTAAVKRGKAYKRAQAQRAREAAMAERAEAKRVQRTLSA